MQNLQENKNVVKLVFFNITLLDIKNVYCNYPILVFIHSNKLTKKGGGEKKEIYRIWEKNP